MRFTTTSILTLAALATAKPTKKVSYGSWDVTATIDSAANGYKSRDILATYSNSSPNSTITVHCSYSYLPGVPPTETDTCDDAGFSYSLGDNITLTQTVPIGKKEVKVTGTAPITLSCNSATGRYCTGETTVQAKKA
ncbi:hypothetical protein BDV96DRAFT_649370 [Lophiotrema nucula]|uniref:AA1-like domain-containing protein n=1 Tax=Lophiotrema nucula TaxID=690887 RepID=A0A6A5YYN6_9PLEO|nr:hypothetical protein BDV96DRAFT_649370 [Lophiotrema nucula]